MCCRHIRAFNFLRRTGRRLTTQERSGTEPRGVEWRISRFDGHLCARGWHNAIKAVYTRRLVRYASRSPTISHLSSLSFQLQQHANVKLTELKTKTLTCFLFMFFFVTVGAQCSLCININNYRCIGPCKLVKIQLRFVYTFLKNTIWKTKVFCRTKKLLCMSISKSFFNHVYFWKQFWLHG